MLKKGLLFASFSIGCYLKRNYLINYSNMLQDPRIKKFIQIATTAMIILLLLQYITVHTMQIPETIFTALLIGAFATIWRRNF
ncbi:MAG: hypothetical protein RLZZ628_2970 [Bacteroidota bacterium]